MLQVVLTNVRRKRLGMSEMDLCCICDEHEESLFHLFRDCAEVHLVWQYFVRVDSGVDFYTCGDLKSWLNSYLSRTREVYDTHWNFMFGIILVRSYFSMKSGMRRILSIKLVT